MAFFLSPIGNSSQIDANGDPLVGGKIATYLAGSTTATATYTSNTGLTQQANPIILNSLGLPASPIWLAEGIAYKFVISSAADVVLQTIDNIEGVNDAATSASEWVASGFVPTYLTATTFSVPGDQTDTLNVGRRLKTTNTAGTIYSRISASVFGAVTTVTVVNDSGVLDAGLSVVSYGLASPVNPSLPNSSAVRFAMGIGDLVGTQGFRLTLTTGLPVTTADVTGASTLYATPYKGNEIALNTGSAWSVYESAQFSIALSGLTSGRPYDVFCFVSAGIPALELVSWASDTARTTAIDYLDGVLKKSGSNTHRYLGTIYTTAATTTEDSEAKRYVWNYYHRVPRAMKKDGTNATWTYTTATWRQAQAVTTNQVDFVVGVVEDSIAATVQTYAINDTGTVRNIRIGLGLNSTTAPTGVTQLVSVDNTRNVGMANSTVAFPALGKNYIAWLEIGAGTDVATFFGTTNGGLCGQLMA